METAERPKIVNTMDIIEHNNRVDTLKRYKKAAKHERKAK